MGREKRTGTEEDCWKTQVEANVTKAERRNARDEEGVREERAEGERLSYRGEKGVIAYREMQRKTFLRRVDDEYYNHRMCRGAGDMSEFWNGGFGRRQLSESLEQKHNTT